MNYKESLELLTSQGKFHINLGLERIKKIAELLNNPQEQLKVIHVAGTNGKGSVCAMLAKVLQEQGLKTGLYTSPHIKSYTERFKINFQNISEEKFAKYFEYVENAAQKNNIELTEFEILTMIAFLYFNDEETDIVILETGMGGRLDATNIITNPILTIITSISLDHLDRLGSTIKDIAREKAGILKPNVPVIISKNNRGFDTVTFAVNKIGCPIFSVEKDFILKDEKENIFTNGIKSYQLSLRGVNQGENLALVDKASEYLNINPQQALKNVHWECRFEYKDGILFDAAHNPDGVKLLKTNLETYYKNNKRMFLFGVLNTKNYKQMIQTLFNSDDIVYITDNFAHNAVAKTTLENEIKNIFPTIQTKLIEIEDVENFQQIKFPQGIKICCGSFYLCSQLFRVH